MQTYTFRTEYRITQMYQSIYIYIYINIYIYATPSKTYLFWAYMCQIMPGTVAAMESAQAARHNLGLVKEVYPAMTRQFVILGSA